MEEHKCINDDNMAAREVRKDGSIYYRPMCNSCYYRRKDPNKVREYRRLYREKNRKTMREKALIYNRSYRKISPRSWWADKKASAKRKGIVFNISSNDFVLWWNEQNNTCYYCGRSFVNKRLMQIDRRVPSIGYTLNNIALSCFECNRAKGDTFTDTEWKEIVDKYKLADRFLVRMVVST